MDVLTFSGLLSSRGFSLYRLFISFIHNVFVKRKIFEIHSFYMLYQLSFQKYIG